MHLRLYCLLTVGDCGALGAPKIDRNELNLASKRDRDSWTKGLAIERTGLGFSRGELGQRSVPQLLERPRIPPSASSERELPLSNSVGQLNSAQSNRCAAERLEASHRRASALDDTVIANTEEPNGFAYDRL
jgi:hypothetical protein